MFLISNVLWFGHLGGWPLHEVTRITIFLSIVDHIDEFTLLKSLKKCTEVQIVLYCGQPRCSGLRSGQKLVTYKLDDAFLGAGEPLPCERVPLWAKSEDCTFHR